MTWIKDSSNTVEVNDALDDIRAELGKTVKNSGKPKSPSEGDTYYDTKDHILRCYNGTEWKDLF